MDREDPSERVTEEASEGLHAAFLKSCASHPERPALDVAGQVLTYSELSGLSAAIGATLGSNGSAATASPVAVLAHRSVPAFSGVMGVLMSGRTVVPLHPRFPLARTRLMMRETGARTIIADTNGQAQLHHLLDGIERSLSIILPEANDIASLSQRWPQHTFLRATDFARPEEWPAAPVDLGAPAYFFFTSGSTGEPKCVSLLQRNILHFVENTVRHARLTEHDRFSQFYEPTYDAILSDLFVSWSVGGCVCCPTTQELLNPDRYIREKELTVLDLVPSAGHLMKRMKVLKPGRYPQVRLIRFGGEAATLDLFEAWAAAAPNAIIENLYGPTETTVEVSAFQWNSETSSLECENGFVPIGYRLPGAKLLIADEQLHEQPIGTAGELLIGGPQVSPGYWCRPELTEKAFVIPPGRTERFYCSGDLVRRDSPDGPLLFLGRLDDQIKIYGVRIELREVEAALREETGTSNAVAIGWPKTSSGFHGIVAFIDQSDADAPALIAKLKTRLPGVMVPRQIRPLTDFPLNPNGKVDRTALFDLLEQERNKADARKKNLQLHFVRPREELVSQAHHTHLAGWVYQTDQRHFDWLFGSREAALRSLAEWVVRPNSQFAACCATIAHLDQIAVGATIAMPGSEVSVRQRHDALTLIKNCPREDRDAVMQRLRILASTEIPVEPRDYYIRLVAIDPAHREKGLGRRILQQCLDDGAAGGFRRFRLDVTRENRPALELYRRLGFESAGETSALHLGADDRVLSMVLEREF